MNTRAMTMGTHYAAEDRRHLDLCPECAPFAGLVTRPDTCPEGQWLSARNVASFRTGDVPPGWYRDNPRPRPSANLL